MKKNLTMLTISAFLTLTIGTIGSINTNNSIAYAGNDNNSKDSGSKENKDTGSKDTKDKSSKDTGSKDTKDKSSKDTGSKDTKDKSSKDTTASSHKVKICHYPPGNPQNMHVLEIDESALTAHLKHGDSQGECPENSNMPVNLDGFGVKVVSWREVQGVVSNGYLFESASKKGQFELKSEAISDTNSEKKEKGFDALKLTITSYLPSKEAFKNGDKNSVAKTFEAIVHRQFPKEFVTLSTPKSPTPSPSSDTKDKAPKDTKDKTSKDTKDKSSKDTGSKDTKDKTSKDTGSKDTKDKTSKDTGSKDTSSKSDENKNKNK